MTAIMGDVLEIYQVL